MLTFVLQFSFILVEPGEAGNIGAAARAMNTMGFEDLRLVRPKAEHLSGIAKAFAHGSEHLLERAGVYTQLSGRDIMAFLKAVASGGGTGKINIAECLRELG
ncbi:MAG: TrmH family RNA methyltransferase, partial [Cyanobacteria bacterium J06649_5]